ncbi:hypothetical protein EMCG_05433 [[Emmonsia] crescens]|uniref:SWIM-type domain-containing protein n=1 Tax=[Emmonsia] crescens TaxID=73230 RepID=A0A0G2HQ13_9EURO|nr:hypothetical protein EMCG_05433 [Emmonsia crescens UAMH 3008]
MDAPLPNTPQFITSIIHQLSKFHPPSAAPAPLDQKNNSQHQHQNPPSTETNNTNPLAQLPAPLLSKAKPLLLTLHCLFPNELLLALDILDRKGIRRYDYYNHKPGSEETAEVQRQHGRDIDYGIYFVRSSPSSSSSSYSYSYSSAMNTARPNGNNDANTNNPLKSHLVCLNAWNCSCPAFALAAFRHLDSPQTATRETENSAGEEVSTSTSAFPFGGTLTKDSWKNMHYGTPVCKHLLACLLGSQCPALFGGGVERVYVGGGIEGEGEVAGRFAAS